ncbi:MAG TPA: Gfo/Idh/MocA family oxidoreductase, partial [Afifellaceae bacterium]|nr:Gfo/Idh/MocA family oxidoreductase [Afifellaceae bacterium]
GLIGGGRDSQIGEAHRIAARLDNRFALAAGALDIDPERGRAFAGELGIAPERAYGTWRDMLAAERNRPDRPGLVTVATPNATHFEIAKGFLEAGFHVLVEKPMTMTVAEAVDLKTTAEAGDRLLAVNFGYTGYPLVRQARAMVRQGELGAIRVAVAEFAHGFHADSGNADNPRLRWRYDPDQAGASAALADAGIHALHMIGYVTGQTITRLSAHFQSCVEGRQLEDDALLALDYSGGAVGRLWTSAVAVGQMHGLNLRIFGEKGGLRWHQEQPNQLYWTPLGEATRILERGDASLYPDAAAASRLAIGHVEGLPVAFANLYRDIADAITGGLAAPDGLPLAADGLEMVRAVDAAARSAAEDGHWLSL